MLRTLDTCVLMCALATCGNVYAQGTVIVTGLNNPRGLAFDSDDALYVAEAGMGGKGPCVVPFCFGLTGSITRIDVRTGAMQRIVTGLPSKAAFGVPGFPPGAFAIGPSDISFFNSHGEAFVSIGSGLRGPDRSALFGEGAKGLGYLVQLHGSDNWRASVDLSEAVPAESNPNSVLAAPGKEIVVDSGANALLEVRGQGMVRTLTTFPPLPVNGFTVDSVPTSIVLGPDGYYYVGELTGLHAGQIDGQQTPGAARVYRVNPATGAAEVYRDGFSAIIDIAFLQDGSLCVLEIFNGDIVRWRRTVVAASWPRGSSVPAV